VNASNSALQTQLVTLKDQCNSLSQKLEIAQKEGREYLNKIALMNQDIDRQRSEIEKLKQDHTKQIKENYKLIISKHNQFGCSILLI